MVVLRDHVMSSSSWARLVKEGALAPLYLGHVSIHWDHCGDWVLNSTRDFVPLIIMLYM